MKLRVQDLTKTFRSGTDTIHAVRNVSFEAEAGEFIAIMGPSGSGKTTLLAMIGGLLTPTSGSIEVDGTAVERLSSGGRAEYRRRVVGYVFQANNLVPFLTARENLLIMSYIGGARDRGSAKRRAAQLLEELGLTSRADTLAAELSGGERQRVAIGRALMNDPALVLVDEPTAALDSARGRQVVESLMTEIKSRDKLGIMVTHDVTMAAFADRILEMHDGELRALPRPESSV